MDWKILAILSMLCFLNFTKRSKAWSGQVCTRRHIEYWTERYCSSWFLWWCTYESYRQQSIVITEEYCCPGWQESSTQQCDVPICNPSCEPRGTCVAPNRCNCTTGYTGEYTACTTLKCSHLIPCYPGTCIYNSTSADTCECDTGFSGTGQDACLTMTKIQGMPDIILSSVTLSHLKRTVNLTLFSFVLDGTTEHNDTRWINQKDFNHLVFEFQSLYEPPPLSYRPFYIHDSGFGIVGGQIFVNISKIPRSGGPIRDVAFTKQYICPGLSDTTPNKDVVKCIITEEQFYTNLEDGDWFAVEFTARSGGFRNVLKPNNTLLTQTYRGQTDQEVVEFKFDFEVPMHCSEEIITEICPDFPLRIENEFTKSPINITWGGWTDNISGIRNYHLEIFKLAVNLYGNLTETTPLNPVHSANINYTRGNKYNYIHMPLESGMYSVLLQATDKANNSKIARRLVLYDPNSTISVNVEDENTLYVSSAVGETGYIWQSANNGTKTECTVQWTNHFSNTLISNGKLLNKVSAYPSQFENIERDGILKTKKFVYPGFDDNEGERTIEEKPNKNGIVRFEVNVLHTDDSDEPASGWISVNGLSERYTFSAILKDGKSAQIWVRAHDVLGNKKADSTTVYFDSTPPVLSNNSTFVRNQKGTYNHTSRLTFDAWDADSGVHKIEFRLIRNDNYQITYNGSTPASAQNISCNSKDCKCVLKKCFIAAQVLDLDNCWFMMAKEDLDKVNVTVEVTVYNQALLETKFRVIVDTIHGLQGLEKYSGPLNIRSTEHNINSVRLEWDLPETESCYGRTDIVILLYKPDGSTKEYTVSRNIRFVDVVGLEASRDYTAVFSLGFEGQIFGKISYKFRTADEDKSAVIGGSIGGAVGAVIIIVLVILVIVYKRQKPEIINDNRFKSSPNEYEMY